MAQNFTSPDPLNNSAKTLSIYITELQVCVNERRLEIGQLIVSFIDQRPGKTYRLDAIEELKTLTEQLALDFGYPTGILDSTLLGREFVEHPIRFGKPAAGFPIINDLRLVLEALVQQLLAFATVISDWYDNGAPTVIPLAAYDVAVDEPWPNIPDFIQTGFGTTCPAGFPTCDNTQAGFFRDFIQILTDRSLISISGTGASLVKEGPVGGPYFNVGTSPTSVIAGPTFDNDEDNYYSHGGSSGTGGTVLVAPRNAESAIALLGDFGESFNATNNRLFVTSDKIIMTSSSVSGDLKYGRMNKTTGAVELIVTISFLNINGDSFSNNLIVNWGSGFERGGKVFATYGESYNDGGAGVRTHVVSSAIVEIDQSGVATVNSDSDTFVFVQSPRIPSDPVFIRYAHGAGGQQTINQLIRGNSNGFYYDKRVGGSVIKIGLPSPTDNGTFATFNGVALSTTDYKSATITSHNNVLHSENYLDHSSATPAISPINYDTAVRVNAGFNDEVNVTWTPNSGGFRYRLQRRLASSIVWITTSTVEASDPGVGTGTITGLAVGSDYFVRLLTETGQGLKTGAEVSVPIL